MSQQSDGGNPVTAKQLRAICHDLRQYVAAGLLLTEMPGDGDLAEPVRRRMELLHTQLRHSADLIESVSQTTRPQPSAVDLADLVEECVLVAQAAQVGQDVTIETEVWARPWAYGQPLLLRRAIVNLLDNASRAIEPGGHVAVHVGESGTDAWVEVVDDGRGFGEIPGGTGAGLAVVHSAVCGCGGQLQISSGPGPGTTVRLVLPTKVEVAS